MIGKLAIVGILWALPVVSAQLGIGISDAEVRAQEKQQPQPRKKTRKVPAMREATYKKLAEAQIMIDPESVPREEGEPPPVPKGTPRDAVKMLHEMRGRKGLNSYELAQIWNTLALAYYTLEDIPNTINAYLQILKQDRITEALELSSLRVLFQLYYSEEQYRKSITYIDRWMDLKKTPDADVTFIKATAYYQLENFREALENAIRVEQIAAARGKEIKENWWYLQVVLYNEIDDIDNVIRVLETLLLHYPKKQYWMHLAGMYSEKGWDDQALSAYYAAYIQGFLQRESEVVMLAQRLLAHDDAANPYEASQVLNKGLKEGIVTKNAKNMRLLATAYTLAQETDQAIDAWREAAKFADEGDISLRLAQALANEDRHKEAIEAYKEALKKGDLQDEADTHFWLAISQMQLERWDDATRNFREAGRLDRRKEKQTRSYIRYIAGEKRRQQRLNEWRNT